MESVCEAVILDRGWEGRFRKLTIHNGQSCGAGAREIVPLQRGDRYRGTIAEGRSPSPPRHSFG